MKVEISREVAERAAKMGDAMAELERDKRRLDWLEANAPLSIERILDLRKDPANTETTYVFTPYESRFGRPVHHPSLRSAIDEEIRKGDFR